MADITTTSTSAMPSFVMPYAQGYLQRAQQVADSPYQAFTGQRVADMAPWQNQAYQAQAQRAMSGSPVMNAANQALPQMFQGGGTAAQNPYGPVQAAANPYGYAQTVSNQYGPVQAQANPYAGSNPYLQQSIDSTLGDVTRNWNNVQKPQWDTSMQRSGSFGNSGIAQANQMAQSDMQRNMGNIASGMRMQDYTQQQQLGEAAANRNLQAGQFNASMGDAAAARASQMNQFNAGLGESAAARAMQAGQFNATMGENYAGRQDSMFNQGQGRALSALGMAPAFAQQDYTDINQLQQAGAAYQGQNQRLLDNQYMQFLESRNFPREQLDVMGNALGRSYGQTNTTTQPGASTGSQIVGGALTGAGLYNLLFGGK
jgi:hypothetical protein